MGGTTATEGGGDQALDATDAVARAEAKHWRDLAAAREATVRSLTGRPLVRLAVALDRRVGRAGNRVASWWSGVRATADRALLASGGLLARPALARRRSTLAQQLAGLEPPPTTVGVTLIGFGGSADDVRQAITGVDVGVVSAGPSAGADGADGFTRSVMLHRAAAAATQDLLCFVPGPVTGATPGWLAHLAAAVHGDVVAATPTLLHPKRPGRHATAHDLAVRSEGFSIEIDATGAPVVVARRAGQVPRLTGGDQEVAAAPLSCLVVDRTAYLAAGGLEEAADDDDVAAIGLCTRLRQRGGRVVHAPNAAVFDEGPISSPRALRHPIEPSDPAWRGLVDRFGPSLPLRTGADTATRWVITTAAPSPKVAARWGDWHLAEAMARSLRRLGQEVDVQTLDRCDATATRSHDVHLVLHGLAPVRRTPGQRHIVWVISHPETVEVSACDDADLVLVASERFAAALRDRTTTPVEVLLQATDPDRFRPVAPQDGHRHPVTVVAKTRDVMRPIVADALSVGIRPSIYGSGWRDLVDAELVQADHVDNELLPVVYCSAGVVLNDHWDTMRAWGFVSNRLFDVLACGVPVISDHLDEVRDLFGEAVPTYRTPEELATLVRGALAEPEAARARAMQGRAAVLERHTFDHRARELLELVARHAPPDPRRERP